MSSDRVTVNINEAKIGREVASRLEGKFDDLKRELSRTNESLDDLRDRVDRLERTIEEIERAKARAERQATEDLKETLEDQLEEKREEYERRLGDILADYRGSIERLKERFLNSISGSSEQFDQVEAEFGTLSERRQEIAEGVGALEDVHAANYKRRVDSIVGTRNAFLETIDDFLADREDTAETIDSLQTSVPGVEGATRVQVPFWVVGVERNGNEEIRVYPIQDRGDPTGSPSRADPYAPYLTGHATHDYEDMVDAVEAYVVRDDVRDALASREDEFADPDFLRSNPAIDDRFVDALEEFELTGRDGGTTAGESERAQPETQAEVRADG